ncbi:hypothetical protein AVEN_31739-1 [Araneus ventricosus]|uniref:Tc1-like transposase DDE domain-containing protein n=1 Tax=Araneus ventricosus TaxID=182803 RepID=A0A4Y2K3B4_ARAVE|nr:hypothetical protein AVEN_31739-1 [Araneus ventricosus]
MLHPTRRELLPSGSRNTLLTLDHWPPKSPEMNIIEDIRDALLHAVENRSAPPRTPMWTVLKDEWCELPPRYFQTLVESIPHRVAELLCVRGALHDIRQVYQFFWLFSVYAN